VAVLYGPGTGGMARVSAVVPLDSTWKSALEWVLDPPLVTQPSPGVSYVAINPYRGGMVFEGCTYVNDTTWQVGRGGGAMRGAAGAFPYTGRSCGTCGAVFVGL
jgi:hypothetical protein